MRKLIFLPLLGFALACNDTVPVQPLDEVPSGFTVTSAKDQAVNGVPFTTILFQDDFEDGDSDGWNLWGTDVTDWSIDTEGGNHVLSSSTGDEVAFATVQHPGWYNSHFRSRVKFVSGDTYCELLFRVDELNQHYWLQVTGGGVALAKEGRTGAFRFLAHYDMDVLQDVWYDFDIVTKNKKIKVYVDGSLKIDVKDDNPWGNIGTIGFEVHQDTHVHFDDVLVTQK